MERALAMRDEADTPHGERAIEAARRSGRLKLVLMFLLFSLPVVASYTTYYVIKPQARTNYGALLEPQRDLPAVVAQGLDGAPIALASLRGKWLMLTVDASDCARDCEEKLWLMRQVRLTTGKDRDRVERVWLVSDAGQVAQRLRAEYEGTLIARVDPAALRDALPPDERAGGRLSDHVFVVDPLGNVMMRFPKDADPQKVKKDIVKLLKVSRIG